MKGTSTGVHLVAGQEVSCWSLWNESLMVSAATQVSLLRKHGSHSQLFNGSIMCSLLYENNWLFSCTVWFIKPTWDLKPIWMGLLKNMASFHVTFLFSKEILKISLIIGSYQYCCYFGSRASGIKNCHPFLEKNGHLLCYIVCI